MNLIQIYHTLSILSKINVILGRKKIRVSINYVIDDAISVFKYLLKNLKDSNVLCLKENFLEHFTFFRFYFINELM